MTTFSHMLANSEHYKAIEHFQLWLMADEPDLPWDRVTRVTPGGTISSLGETGLQFHAEIDDLTFSWNWDFATYHTRDKPLDSERFAKIVAKLSSEGREKFAQILSDHIIPKRAIYADQQWKYYDQQVSDLRVLREAAIEARMK